MIPISDGNNLPYDTEYPQQERERYHHEDEQVPASAMPSSFTESSASITGSNLSQPQTIHNDLSQGHLVQPYEGGFKGYPPETIHQTSSTAHQPLQFFNSRVVQDMAPPLPYLPQTENLGQGSSSLAPPQMLLGQLQYTQPVLNPYPSQDHGGHSVKMELPDEVVRAQQNYPRNYRVPSVKLEPSPDVQRLSYPDTYSVSSQGSSYASTMDLEGKSLSDTRGDIQHYPDVTTMLNDNVTIAAPLVEATFVDLKVCNVCGKRITRDMIRHMRTHQSNKRFNCKFPKESCSHGSGQFNRRYDFKKHLLNKHFKFDDSRIKKVHNLSDKLNDWGVCPCGQRFLSGDWLENHILTDDVSRRCPQMEDVSHDRHDTN